MCLLYTTSTRQRQVGLYISIHYSWPSMLVVFNYLVSPPQMLLALMSNVLCCSEIWPHVFLIKGNTWINKNGILFNFKCTWHCKVQLLYRVLCTGEVILCFFSFCLLSYKFLIVPLANIDRYQMQTY